MSSIALSEKYFVEIPRLTLLYYREAQICEQARALLAGCVMNRG